MSGLDEVDAVFADTVNAVRQLKSRVDTVCVPDKGNVALDILQKSGYVPADAVALLGVGDKGEQKVLG